MTLVLKDKQERSIKIQREIFKQTGNIEPMWGFMRGSADWDSVWVRVLGDKAGLVHWDRSSDSQPMSCKQTVHGKAGAE